MKWHLTVDVGNSQLVIVLYRDELRVDGIRVNTHPFPTPGELTESLLRVLKPQGLVGDQVQLTICSSVPAVRPGMA